MNPIFKKLASQTAAYGLSNIVGRFLNYLLIPIYTRVFFPDEYGTVNELYAYASFLGVVFTYGMETAFFRFINEKENKKQVNDTAMLSVVVSSVVLMLLFILFSQPLANSIRYQNHHEYIIWFALILGFDAMTAIPFAKLRAKNLPGHYVFYKLFNIGVTVALNLFFLVACPWLLEKNPDGFISHIYNRDFGVGYVFVSNLAASALTFLIMSPFIFRRAYDFSFSLWKKMFRYAFPLLFVGLAGMVNETMDRLLLKFNLPGSNEHIMEQIGIYGACYKLSLLMTLFVQAFRMAGEPFFFGEAKKENAKQVYSMVMNYFVIACLFIFLLVMLGMDVFKYFIGSKYHEGLGIVPILLLANLCLGVYYNLTIWYKLTNKTNMGAWISIMGAGITLILNFWWIPIMGYWGSAWATLICYASMMVVSYLLGQKYFFVPYNIMKAGIYFSVAMGCWLTSKFLTAQVNDYSHAVPLFINVSLLFIFTVFVYLVEVKKIFAKKLS